MASRQYGLILDLIDKLPRTSHTKSAMEEDPEYVELVREAYIQQAGKEEAPSGPSIKEWTELKEMTADIVDELRIVGAKIVATAGSKETPKPYERPSTLMMQMSSSAKIARRRLKHEELVNRLVPKKE